MHSIQDRQTTSTEQAGGIAGCRPDPLAVSTMISYLCLSRSVDLEAIWTVTMRQRGDDCCCVAYAPRLISHGAFVPAFSA